MDLTQPPPTLKALAMYTKCAVEHDTRDPVVAYYCRLYAAQRGMELDRKSPEAKLYLSSLMDILDESKTKLKENEAIVNEIVGQAHVEQCTLKLFQFACTRDSAADFGPATIKSFYTSSLLVDVLGVFGDISEDMAKVKKYASRKAIYITKCLKSGETPVPGPFSDAELPQDLGLPASPSHPVAGASSNRRPSSPTNVAGPSNHVSFDAQPADAPSSPGPIVSPELFLKAEKAAKYAISAMQYQDRTTALQHLNEALRMLSTGHE